MNSTTLSAGTPSGAARPTVGEIVRSDFLASIVVFLVALPLCMGIAVASGVPPAAGLMTGVIGGLVVGLLAGSPLQVSGPAAGLTVIVMEIVTRQGLGVLGGIVLLAGVLQIVLGALRLGQVFRAVSPAVIHGMLAGIGVLILGSQFHVMVDDPKRGSGLENLLSIPEAIVKGVVPLDGSTHHIAAAIGLLTIVLIVLWPVVAPRKLRVVPAALVGVGTAAIVAWVFRLDISYVTIPDRIWDAVSWPTRDSLADLLSRDVLISAITIALVASAETLLCASAVDQLHSGPRTKYDRELVAQGVGNSLCGLVGALPMTGVIVRSSANVNAGGRSRLSTILHGVWLLGFVVVLPDVIRMIPMAALGALLVYTGYKLAHPAPVRNLLKFGKGEVAIYLLTLVTIVVFDLLTGVIAGILASAIKLLHTFSHLKVSFETSPDGKRTYLHLNGAATFVRLPRLASALERVPANTELHVRVEELSYIDHACLELLENWRSRHEAKGGALVLDWDALNHRSPLLAAGVSSAASKARVPVPAFPARAADRKADRDPITDALRDEALFWAASPDAADLEVGQASTGVFARPLIGLALTESDRGLLQYVAQVADLRLCEHLHYVHVLDPGRNPPSAEEVEALRSRMRAEVQAHFGRSGVDAVFDVVQGAREDELLAVATENHCDVIILGHSQPGGSQRSLAKRMAMVANCSVWLVPAGAAARLRTVLVPVDFSEHSAEALKFAAMIVAEQGIERCLALHVCQETPATHFGERAPVVLSQVRANFAEFLERIDLQGVQVDMLLEEDSRPAETILRVAEQHDVDLIVMNTQGRSRAAAVLLGSITSRTMEATRIPLLAFKHLGSRRTLLRALFHPRRLSVPSLAEA